MKWCFLSLLLVAASASPEEGEAVSGADAREGPTLRDLLAEDGTFQILRGALTVSDVDEKHDASTGPDVGRLVGGLLGRAKDAGRDKERHDESNDLDMGKFFGSLLGGAEDGRDDKQKHDESDTQERGATLEGLLSEGGLFDGLLQELVGSQDRGSEERDESAAQKHGDGLGGLPSEGGLLGGLLQELIGSQDQGIQKRDDSAGFNLGALGSLLSTDGHFGPLAGSILGAMSGSQESEKRDEPVVPDLGGLGSLLSADGHVGDLEGSMLGGNSESEASEKHDESADLALAALSSLMSLGDLLGGMMGGEFNASEMYDGDSADSDAVKLGAEGEESEALARGLDEQEPRFKAQEVRMNAAQKPLGARPQTEQAQDEEEAPAAEAVEE